MTINLPRGGPSLSDNLTGAKMTSSGKIMIMVLMLMLTFEILMLMMLTWKKNTIGEDDSLCTAASALNNNFPAVSHKRRFRSDVKIYILPRPL